MLLKGVLLALTAGAMHSANDLMRKAAHTRMGLSSTALVALCAIIDAVIGGGYSGVQFLDFHMFVIVVCCSSTLLVATKVLYQLAISSSPLSLTVPYIALTPAFLVGTAFILVGEQPTAIGLAGVGIVTLGGYLLSRVATSPDATDVPKHSYDVASNPKDEGDGLLQDAREDGSAAMYQPSMGLGGKATRRSGSSGSSMDKLTMVGSRSCWERITQLPRQPRLSGSLMMLCVAAAWSITASLDKLGVRYGSLWTYFAAQRLIIGAMCVLYLLRTAPETFRLLRSHFWILLAISLVEMCALVVFLEAIKFILVSYVVALKRSNVLLSVLVGGFVFKENIARRLPYVVLMLCGMTCIVLDPKS